MKSKNTTYIVFFICMIALILGHDLIAQEISNPKKKDFLEHLISNLNIEGKVTEQQMVSWSDKLYTYTEKAPESISLMDKLNNWQQFFAELNRVIESPDSLSPNRLRRLAANVLLSNFDWKPYIEEGKPTPYGDLGSYEKYGSGNDVIILIPEIGFDFHMYEPLIHTLSETNTVYAITLPGFGSTKPYSRLEKRDPSQKLWLKGVEQGLIKLVEKEKIKDFFLLGTGYGGYTAVNVASKMSEETRGVILVNSPLYKQHYNGFTAVDLDYETRLKSAKHSIPIEEFLKSGKIINISNSYHTSLAQNRDLIEEHVIRANQGNKFAYEYFKQELASTDLRETLLNMEVPVLVVNSLHDHSTPSLVSSRVHLIQWSKFLKKNNKSSIQTIVIDKARDFIFPDKPEEFNQYLRAFLYNPRKSVLKPELKTKVIDVSPRAFISQTFSSTDVSIEYYRPAVRGRDIWGKLVPFDQVWRAGANEATRFIVSRDVILEGLNGKKTLPAGEYSLFVIPKETGWTFIFNSIPYQWGSYNYNAEFDVIRMDAEVETIAHQEYLEYRFENLNSGSIDVSLKWDSLKAGIRISESFRIPRVTGSVKNLNWTEILTDKEGDKPQNRRISNFSDGKSLSYAYDRESDSLWFRFETYNDIDTLNPALSLSFDTDLNQENGVNWYGSNNSFKIDMMVSLGIMRYGEDYTGYNGITDSDGISNRNWINVKKGNVSWYFEPDKNAYYLGVSRKDLGKDVYSFNLIGSVGRNAFWNDDIGEDGTFATIDLK